MFGAARRPVYCQLQRLRCLPPLQRVASRGAEVPRRVLCSSVGAPRCRWHGSSRGPDLLAGRPVALRKGVVAAASAGAPRRIVVATPATVVSAMFELAGRRRGSCSRYSGRRQQTVGRSSPPAAALPPSGAAALMPDPPRCWQRSPGGGPGVGSGRRALARPRWPPAAYSPLRQLLLRPRQLHCLHAPVSACLSPPSGHVHWAAGAVALMSDSVVVRFTNILAGAHQSTRATYLEVGQAWLWATVVPRRQEGLRPMGGRPSVAHPGAGARARPRTAAACPRLRTCGLRPPLVEPPRRGPPQSRSVPVHRASLAAMSSAVVAAVGRCGGCIRFVLMREIGLVLASSPLSVLHCCSTRAR